MSVTSRQSPLCVRDSHLPRALTILLRCKFTPSSTFVYDTMSAHTDAPQFWRNWTVNAMGRLGSLVFCHRGPQPPRRWVGVSLGSEGLRTGTWQALSPESYGGSCEIRGEA